MADLILGSGEFTYRYVDGWPKIPDGMSLVECPEVVVDSQDNVYLLTRGEHPIVAFDQEGNFLRSFGEGEFNWTHGLYIAPDDTLLAADGGYHVIAKYTPQGERLLELGRRDNPAPKWGGEPFNIPTSAAVMPGNGDIYVADGYGNARIHCYTAQGQYKFSWGSPGIDAGQFIRPHNIAIDDREQLYVVDREAHRIQVFDPQGNFITMWNNIHRPDSMTLWQDHIYVGELSSIAGLEGCPGLGHRVSIYDLEGNLKCRFGDPVQGDQPGQFMAPHGVAVDSRGDLYVSEVSYSIVGRRMDPPRELRSISKYQRIW